MSADSEQQSESAAAPEEELEAWRASGRCGRTLPPVHLTELEETVLQRHHWRDPIVLCGAENVPELDPYDPDEDCPGCRDCLRYCPECAGEAGRYSAEAGQADHAPRRRPSVQDDYGEPVGYVMSASGPHRVDGGTAGLAAGTGRG
ncbi:MAG: hypothetical protein M3408_12740 [Actinomycetota bacterium]|nr:hypothetical protein [Actinomycetota bacterium]